MPQAPQEISGQALAAMANQGLRWLFDCAAPQWRGAQRCGNFLFPERFSVDGQADACPRRLFVQARHIYSFCEIGRLGWTGPWRPMVEASADFLLANGRRPDGFFIHRFDAHGAPLDFRADLYDQAFMLLALAHAGKAAGRPDYFRAAESLDETLQAKWRLPLAVCRTEAWRSGREAGFGG